MIRLRYMIALIACIQSNVTFVMWMQDQNPQEQEQYQELNLKNIIEIDQAFAEAGRPYYRIISDQYPAQIVSMTQDGNYTLTVYKQGGRKIGTFPISKAQFEEVQLLYRKINGL